MKKFLTYLSIAVATLLVLIFSETALILLLESSLLIAVVLGVVGLGAILLSAFTPNMAKRLERAVKALILGEENSNLSYEQLETMGFKERVLKHIAKCEKEVQANKSLLAEIREEISKLEIKLASVGTYKSARNEMEAVIKSWQEQYSLKEKKLAFYEASLEKLQTLLHNGEVIETIAKSKAKLSKLQGENFSELAEIETLKQELEMDHYYLDSIEELSLKMHESESFDSVSELNQEMEEVTRELKRL